MDWLWYLLLAAVLLFGLVLTLLTLPGVWLMVAATACYGWETGWKYFGYRTMIALLALAIVGEVVESTAGSAGARKAGGSKRSMWGAVIGGIIGGIVFTIPIPIPIVGTVIGIVVGICLGTFLGAMIAEFAGRPQSVHAVRVGVGAAKGRFVGIVYKICFAIAILITSLWMAMPWRKP